MTDITEQALRFRDAVGLDLPVGWKVEMKADRTAEVMVYGGIGLAVNAADFVKEIKSLDVDSLTVRVNSPGGSAFDGLAIKNVLQQHRARVTVMVDGLAASAASLIAMAGDEIVMGRGSEMMVHNAHGMAMGGAEDMRALADLLDRLSNDAAAVYSDRAGGSVEMWRSVMAAETWFTAEEAVEAGLADRVLEAPTKADRPEPKASFDLSAFTYAGRANAPAPKPPAAPAAGPVTPTEGSPAVAFSDEQLTTLRQRLGVAESADETAILAALDEALDEQAEASQTSTPQVPEGMTLVPQALLTELQQSAVMTRQLAERQRVTERTDLLDGHATKFPPAARASMEVWFDQDPEAVRTHLAAAPDAFPVSEIGHGGSENAPPEDSWFPQYASTSREA